MRILVLEDLPSESKSYCNQIKEFGYKIVDKLILADSIKALGEYNVDLVLIDISRKESNGLEAFSELQALNQNLCMVILSIHDEKNVAVEFIKKGAQDYLVKAQSEPEDLERCFKFSAVRNRVAIYQRRREERMKQVLEESYDAFISMNSNLEITDWNPIAERTFGWRRDEVIGHRISFIAPLHLQTQFIRNIENHFERQEGNFLKTSREIVARHCSGKFFAAEFGVYKLEEDSECSFYAYLRDISKEKKTKNELERLVAKRTEELTRSNNELGQFAKIASHDLQEPLRAIEGFALLLAKSTKGGLNDNCDDFIDFIIDGTKRMKELTQSILTHSQVAAIGSIDQVTDCNSVIEDVFVDMQELIEESGASFQVDHLPEVAVERSQVVQLFQNLISNCIKYRSKKPPIISIRAEKAIKRWNFAFEDNGIGIEAKYADGVFDMFSRLHSKEEYPGTGMGLAICKRIVNSHGGTIWLESTFGKGCNFMFTLPSVKKGRKLTMENTINILLVEDTPSDVRLTQEALKESCLKHTLNLTKNGIEAMQYLEELKEADKPLPDVILLDLNMPKMNGHQVLESIKNDEILRSIPVILLTVSERDEDVLEALGTKMNYYLPKPVTTEKFSILLKEIYEVNSLMKRDSNNEHTREETHIRLVLAGNPHTSQFALSKLADAEEESVRSRVARNSKIPAAVQMTLSRDPKSEVRISLCENHNLMSSVLEMLADDGSEDVRMAVSKSAKVPTQILLKLIEDDNVYVSESAKKSLAYRS